MPSAERPSEDPSLERGNLSESDELVPQHSRVSWVLSKDWQKTPEASSGAGSSPLLLPIDDFSMHLVSDPHRSHLWPRVNRTFLGQHDCNSAEDSGEEDRFSSQIAWTWFLTLPLSKWVCFEQVIFISLGLSVPIYITGIKMTASLMIMARIKRYKRCKIFTCGGSSSAWL